MRWSSRRLASPPDSSWAPSQTTWRRLDSVTDNHPEVTQQLPGPWARGGKLFPRARISEAATAAAPVVSPVTTATRRKQDTPAWKVKGLRSEDTVYPDCGDVSSVPPKFLPLPAVRLGRGWGEQLRRYLLGFPQPLFLFRERRRLPHVGGLLSQTPPHSARAAEGWPQTPLCSAGLSSFPASYLRCSAAQSPASLELGLRVYRFHRTDWDASPWVPDSWLLSIISRHCRWLGSPGPTSLWRGKWCHSFLHSRIFKRIQLVVSISLQLTVGL